MQNNKVMRFDSLGFQSAAKAIVRNSLTKEGLHGIEDLEAFANGLNDAVRNFNKEIIQLIDANTPNPSEALEFDSFAEDEEDQTNEFEG